MSVFASKLAAALGLRFKCAEQGKRRYSTYEEALTVARRRVASGKDPASFLQPYPCEHGCGGFHITSRPFRDRVAEFPVVGAWDEDAPGGVPGDA